jgi:hypothetical protein
VLLEIAKDPTPRKCEKCKADRRIHVAFDFKLGASGKDGVIERAFTPGNPNVWAHDKDRSKVVFYPFLVILDREDFGKPAAWLPYWHKIRKTSGGEQSKYGQYAPFMDSKLFADLIHQARKAGYFRDD